MAKKRKASRGRSTAPDRDTRDSQDSGEPSVQLYPATEAAARAGVSRQVLHNYTVMGLVTPAKRTPTNRRYYDETAVRRVRLIRRMLESGYTLQSLRELFPWED